ncbi:MAG: uncharacterized UPF0160 family protein [Psychromonas sp.]|jgi:uncharacterized UPF0160 family protein|uniref:MYG1 family protein n=1 Tax=Psychromonas sp. TaxID=1884585 RepID=UPI0039E5C4F8
MTIKKSQLVTHDGSFHADEVTAVALLLLYKIVDSNQLEIIRTRNIDLIKQADIVLDVGGIHDIKTCRFDHHQIKDGQVSSVGMVWSWIKQKTCEESPEIDAFVLAIDKHDCGIEKMSDFSFTAIIAAYNCADLFNEKQQQLAFYDAFKMALKFLTHLQKKQLQLKRSAKIIAVSEVKEIGKNKVLILSEYAPSWPDLVHGESKYTEITHVLWFVKEKNQWCIQIPSDKKNSFVMGHPKLNDDDNAIFIHQNGFFGVYKSKEAFFDMLGQ